MVDAFEDKIKMFRVKYTYSIKYKDIRKMYTIEAKLSLLVLKLSNAQNKIQLEAS